MKKCGFGRIFFVITAYFINFALVFYHRRHQRRVPLKNALLI